MDRIWLRTPSGIDLMYTLPLDEYIDRQWRDGTLTRVTEDGEVWDGDPFAESSEGGGTTVGSKDNAESRTPEPATEGASADVPVRPAANAPKPEWVAYAEALGLDPDGMTKPQIVDLVTPAEMKPEV